MPDRGTADTRFGLERGRVTGLGWVSHRGVPRWGCGSCTPAGGPAASLTRQRPLRLTVSLRLQVEQPGIRTVQLHQLGVAAQLNYSAVRKHDDAVGHAHG